MIAPLVCAALIIALFFNIPFYETFNPVELDDIGEIETASYDGCVCISVTVDEAYYTGYDFTDVLGSTYSYYYTITDAGCVFMLIRADGTPDELEEFAVSGMLTELDSNTLSMAEDFAGDIGWNYESLIAASSPVIINAAVFKQSAALAILAVLLVALAVCAAAVLLNLFYFIRPAAYPLFRGGHSGKKKKRKRA